MKILKKNQRHFFALKKKYPIGHSFFKVQAKAEAKSQAKAVVRRQIFGNNLHYYLDYRTVFSSLFV